MRIMVNYVHKLRRKIRNYSSSRKTKCRCVTVEQKYLKKNMMSDTTSDIKSYRTHHDYIIETVTEQVVPKYQLQRIRIY